MDCIFCRIVAGEIPADVVFQDAEFLAFRDIHPQAPVHILIVPKTHIASMNEVTDKQQSLMGKLLFVAKEVAEKEKIAEKGYRLTINCGPDGGQIVPHLHLHLMGGHRLDDLMC
jgi:histidine triad (HIT) family protein